MPINPERLRKLMDFGLTEYQARAYLTLLDLETATASQIPPLSRVPRTRIYSTMQQLHEKGLVEIIPETPLRYKVVPFASYLVRMAQDLREQAERLEKKIAALSKEFAVRPGSEAAHRGRFEAVYGRRNARERLIRMYSALEKDAIGIGTTKSPGRILQAFGSVLTEKAKDGARLRYAFKITRENWDDVQILRKYADVRHIDFAMPIYMHGVDRHQFFLSHPIPDDESFYRGDDICIWTDDPAIVEAIWEMAERIWEGGATPKAP
jgi:sugar-specific transcriptional regulator TrmB